MAQEGTTGKPIDRWLSLAAIVVGILLYLLPKTEPVIIACCVLTWGLLVHPFAKFWWIERRIWRQITAVLVLTGAVSYLGIHIKPDKDKEPAQSEIPMRSDARPTVPKEAPAPAVKGKTPKPRVKPLEPQVRIEQHGSGNGAILGSVTQGPCSNLQVGGSNSQASINCAPEWHFTDAQRIKWSSFVATLPQECAGILVVGDIPDRNSHDFALEMFKILDEHQRVNRLGHFLSGDFGEGVEVQIHDEGDVNAPTARLIVLGMHDAGIPVTGLVVSPHVLNHEIHIVVAYKPSQ